jgi:L-ascorbate metabolism protein UlaG (beta-lactamase superfamily)
MENDMSTRQIKIEHAPNGYVVTESHSDHGRYNGVLAVFNHMPDLTAWLAKNFCLPEQVDKEGGAA